MFKFIDFYWRPGSWRHPDEWVFSITHCPQDNGCVIFDVGFFQMTIVRGDCQGKEL
jgi:hypothetical protein